MIYKKKLSSNIVVEYIPVEISDLDNNYVYEEKYLLKNIVNQIKHELKYHKKKK